MNASRNKNKEANKQQHQTLAAAEAIVKRKKKTKALREKKGDILIDLGKLVFGGVIVGGVFEHPEMPIFYYVMGVLAFVSLLLWGIYIYDKSLND